MARVLVLSLVYRPDTVSTANLIGELVDGLRQKGHDITVLTSVPHYNPTAELKKNRAYRTSFFRWFTETDEDGVRVFRIAMPRKGRRKWTRLFDYLWLHTFSTVLAAAKIRRRFAICLVHKPPPSLRIKGYRVVQPLLAKVH